MPGARRPSEVGRWWSPCARSAGCAPRCAAASVRPRSWSDSRRAPRRRSATRGRPPSRTRCGSVSSRTARRLVTNGAWVTSRPWSSSRSAPPPRRPAESTRRRTRWPGGPPPCRRRRSTSPSGSGATAGRLVSSTPGSATPASVARSPSPPPSTCTPSKTPRRPPPWSWPWTAARRPSPSAGPRSAADGPLRSWSPRRCRGSRSPGVDRRRPSGPPRRPIVAGRSRGGVVSRPRRRSPGSLDGCSRSWLPGRAGTARRRCPPRCPSRNAPRTSPPSGSPCCPTWLASAPLQPWPTCARPDRASPPPATTPAAGCRSWSASARRSRPSAIRHPPRRHWPGRPARTDAVCGSWWTSPMTWVRSSEPAWRPRCRRRGCWMRGCDRTVGCWTRSRATSSSRR